MKKLSKEKYKFLYNINLRTYFIIFLTFCIPIFNIQLKEFGNILVNGFLIILLFPSLYFNKKKIVKELKENTYLGAITTLIFCYFLMILLSMYVGIFVPQNKIILRDFYEFHKPILYISIIFYIYCSYCNDPYKIKYEKILYFIFVILFFFYFMTSNQYEDFLLLYIDNNIYNSMRLTAPFGNPYDYAFVMVFFCIFFYYKSIFSNIIFLFPFLISLFLLIETSSKSNFWGFVIIFLTIIQITIFYTNFSKIKKLLHFFLIFIFLFFIPILIVKLSGFNNIFHQFLQFYNDGNIGESGNIRIEQFLMVLERAENNPITLIFGNGPVKGLELGLHQSGLIFYSEHLESAPTYFFFRYGLVGIILFGSLYLIIIKLLFINNKNLSNLNNIKIINLSILTWFLFIPICSAGGVYMEQPRASFFYYLLIAFSLLIKKNLIHYKKIDEKKTSKN
jgi:hypothetical protein